MDRGAARSRKRAQKAEAKPAPAESNAQLAKLLEPKQGKGKGKGNGRPPHKRKEKPEAGPDQYKAKAIRTAKALVYSQAAFSIPPPPERLEGVTRVDLDGAECTDISWLPSSVTWLSVKGCQVTDGWEVVGALEGLTGELPWLVLADTSPQHQQLWADRASGAPRRLEGPQGARGDSERVDLARRDRRRGVEGAELS
jgi:hypothetical protein